jgi:hypothetical protein
MRSGGGGDCIVMVAMGESDVDDVAGRPEWSSAAPSGSETTGACSSAPLWELTSTPRASSADAEAMRTV